jgi:hypothetical protein
MENERLGEVGKNNNGTEMKIVKYVDSENMDVIFLDGHNYVAKNVSYNNFKRGVVKNPFEKNVYGIGYLGIGDHLVVENGSKTQAYMVWHEMIGRCYKKQKHRSSNTYYKISTVCDEWKCFQVFAEWYYKEMYYIKNERLHLDKDILYANNKIYSPFTCMLVPQRINSLFTNRRNTRGLPNGVFKTTSGKYMAKYGVNSLGCYMSVEEAFDVYARHKEKVIKSFANEYRKKIPEKLYNALIDYKIDIRHDKNYQTINKTDVCKLLMRQG